MKCKGLEKVMKGKKNILKKPKKRLVIIFVIVLMLLIAAIIVAIIANKTNNGEREAFPFGNMQGGGKQITLFENTVSVSGVTSVGVTEECFNVENLMTTLKVEEVYVNSEDTITAGTKVLKLSEESIEEAREELEQTLKDADLAYRAGAIEYEQNKINAEYNMKSKLLGGEQAKAVYDETLSGLETSVQKAEDKLTQAKEDIAEYQSYVNNDSYRSYFKVDEYQAIYDETLEALMEKMEEWGISWPQVTGQGGGNNMGNNGAGGTVSGGDAIENTGPSSDQIQVLASLYDVLEIQRNKLDQAQLDYENALANSSFELQTLELELPELENALTEAEKNYQNQILQAELTYETALEKAESAESDYETALQKAETDFEALKKAWEDAQENLDIFESSVGDGYYYASGDGTILRTMVSAGQNLTSEGIIFMYSNPEEMTVTVSVDQADISGIMLEDSVYIQSNEYGGFGGTVTEINPVSNSESRTNVSYSVTVKFGGDTTEIPANESVTVIFGMGEEMIQNMINTSGKGRQEGRKPVVEGQ